MIRRRSEPYETKTGHERWLVSYSDFITLLFAFFVVMYSVSQVSEQKYRILSDTLSSAFEGKIPVDPKNKETLEHQAQNDLGTVSGISPDAISDQNKMIASKIQQTLVNLANPDDVTISATEDWVEIEVNANLLFPSAKADPSNEAKDIFKKMAVILSAVPNEIEVSGHTDNIPIRTTQFRSNWELSAARASSVVRLLAEGGVSPTRLSAVGYGEFRPEASNDAEQGRAKNRRVVLRVARQVQEPKPLPLILDPTSLRFGEQREQEMLPPTLLMPNPESQIDNESGTDLDRDEVNARSDDIEPVRLQNGGLLFSSDPDLPRE